MPINILMPALSPTMTEGTLARWVKKEGEAVRAGDVVAEIETDKATMEVEAVDEGVLGKILVPDGTQNVKVNEPIGVLLDEGESLDGAGAAPTAKPPPPPELPKPKPTAEKPASPPAPSAKQEPVRPAAAPTGSGVNGADDAAGRVFASPLARRMAKQAGIDLAALKGTGPGGRIVKADIEAAHGAAPAAAQAAPAREPAAAKAPAAEITAPHRLAPNSGVRKVIARRLSEAKQTIPHFYVSTDIQLDALLKLRADLNGRSAKEGPGAFKLSVNDMLIKAAAVALRRVPQVNASWGDDAIALYDDVDISVAVSVPDGLITPIVRRADQKGLAAISNEIRSLVERAKAGKLKPEEFQGGGFSISNMGMYGVSEFAAIINPPQAAILAVAAGEQRPVVRDGALAIATVMTCTLSVDHRAIDGALAAQWLTAFRAIVEDPLSLML